MKKEVCALFSFLLSVFVNAAYGGTVTVVSSENQYGGHSVEFDSSMNCEGKNTYPFGIGLFSPNAQFPAADDNVSGLRINLISGECVDMVGLDIGVFANVVSDGMFGLQLSGLYGFAGGDSMAVQMSGIGNRCSGNLTGLQISGVFNYCDYSSTVNGVQFSLANVCGSMNGLQVGIYNKALDVYGIQIGIVNGTRRLTGVQIGLINLVKDSTVPFMPILNAGF